MFETRFDRPMRVIVGERLAHMEINNVVTYADLAALLPGTTRAAQQAATRAATVQIERDKSRTLAVVPGVGYRMVAAVEHEGLARKHHRSSRRQLVKASRKIKSADRTLLDAEQRARFDGIELNLSQQASMIRRLDDRVSATEKNLQDARRQTSGDIAEVSERVEKLAQALSRAGITESAVA